MPVQLSFAGFKSETPRSDRLFFAILPNEDAAARIARLAQDLRGEHGLRGQPLRTGHFHISLHHLGDHVGLPSVVVAAARGAAADVAAPQFDVAFDRVASFAGGRVNQPLVLLGSDGFAALTAFRQVLGAMMAKGGLGHWVQPQKTPHLTLLYDERRVSEQTIATIGWTVREFVLVHSLVGRSRLVVLARWPLQAR